MNEGTKFSATLNRIFYQISVGMVKQWDATNPCYLNSFEWRQC